MAFTCKSCGCTYVRNLDQSNNEDFCQICFRDRKAEISRSIVKMMMIFVKVNETYVGNCAWDCDFLADDAGTKCMLFQQISLRKSINTGNYERCSDCIKQFGE